MLCNAWIWCHGNEDCGGGGGSEESGWNLNDLLCQVCFILLCFELFFVSGSMLSVIPCC